MRSNNKLTGTTDAAFDKHINHALAAGEKSGEFERPKGPSGPTKLAKKGEKKPEASKPAASKAKKPATPKSTTAKVRTGKMRWICQFMHTHFSEARREEDGHEEDNHQDCNQDQGQFS